MLTGAQLYNEFHSFFMFIPRSQETIRAPLWFNAYPHNLNLTKPTGQSPWKSNRSSTSQEIPCILWNLKFHYHVHRSRPHVPVQSQINPVHDIPSYFFKICINIILPSKLRSCKQPISFRFSKQHSTRIDLLSHTWHTTRLSHSSPFDHPNNIW